MRKVYRSNYPKSGRQPTLFKWFQVDSCPSVTCESNSADSIQTTKIYQSDEFAKGMTMSKKNQEPLICIIIDDDPSHRLLLQTSLNTAYASNEIEIMEYGRAEEAMVDLPPDRLAVIICDYQLGGASGLDWLPDFIRADIGPVILATSSGNQEIAAEAFRQGASDYVEKGAIFQNPKELRRTVTESIRKYQFKKANKELSRKLKMANRELEQKNKTLAQLTNTAHRFVDDVAHEFRTPLAVIKEFASIITDGIGGEVTDKQVEFLSYINDASTDLAQLIDDFLDSSKLRARTLRVKRCEHSVSDLFDAVWPTLETRAATKSITLERRINDPVSTVFADADKVNRSLINLVVNAVKFSNPDAPVILDASTDNHGMVVINVIDQGSGLPPEETKKLFERFKQSENAEHIDSKGFGLGLNIVKELVAINLGEVSVESEYGSGSTFSFTLPQFSTDSIIDSVLARAKERNPFGTLCVMSASYSDESGSQDDLVSFLSSSCYPTDVVIPQSSDGTVYVIGDTIEPDRWQKRLTDLYAARNKAKPNGHLNVTLIGMWPIQEARKAITDLVSPPTEVKYCA